MTISYTGNLKLALPITGTEAGTWGDVVNQQITSLLDQSVAGTVSLTSMTNADYTLTSGNGSTANEARYMALLVPATLTLTGARNIIVPTSSKAYIIRNLSTGGFAVTLKTSGGAGISVPNGKTMALYCDGTNVIDGTDYLSSLTLGTALPVLSGGTGVTTSTGTGSVVLNTSPTLITPALGTPSSGTVTNLTGTASININGTVGATTANTGAFTTLTSTSLYTQTATEATVRLTTTGQKTYDLISGGGGNLAAGYFAIRNNTNGNNPFYIDPAAPANCAYISTTGLAITGTLSATGGVTLSGGTANGVAYLDGSKVLTTGSALVFNGTQFGINASPSQALDVTADAAGIAAFRSIGSGGNDKRLLITTGGDNVRLDSANQSGGAASMAFSINSAEQMRLTSTGLGIGTNSPSEKLSISSNTGILTALVEQLDSTGATLARFKATHGSGTIGSLKTGNGFVTIGAETSAPVVFVTSDTERMRLDASGNLGIGTSSPVYQAQIYGVGQQTAALTDAGNKGGSLLLNTPTVNVGDGGALLFGAGGAAAKPFAAIKGLLSNGGSNTAGFLAFATRVNTTDTALTEAMRLDASGNLGIGTSSPAQRLALSASAANVGMRMSSIGGTGRDFDLISNTAGNLVVKSDLQSNILTYDGILGNLGLGVTPSAWTGGYKAIQIGATGALWQSASGFTFLSDNSYTDSGAVARYITTNGASLYRQNTGSHNWFNAPSGTAGNAITFTQAMTLDASGNLGLGNTNPTVRLDITGSVQIRAAGILNLNNSDSSNQYYWQNIGATGANNATLILSRTNAGETLRVDASGNLGLGVTPSAWAGGYKAFQMMGGGFASDSPAELRVVNNAYYNGTDWLYTGSYGASNYRQTQGAHQWFTAASGTVGAIIGFGNPMMTLTAVGELLVGRTGSSGLGKLNVEGGADFTGGNVLLCRDTGSVGIGTSSPGAKLDVAGTFNGTQAVFGNTSGRGLLIGTALNGGVNEGSTVLNARGAGNGQFLFQTDGTTRAVISDSGNLGLGVTPSAWTAFKVLQLTGGGALAGAASQTELWSNAYYDGASKYFGTGLATRYQLFGGEHRWSTAPSGTAGNAITFTQAMTLTAAGNLGIGVTSSSWNTLAKVVELSNTGNAVFGNGLADVRLTSNAYFDSTWKYAGSQLAGTYEITTGIHKWNIAATGTAGAAITFTQAMTLDASGNLLVGTTSAAGYRLRVYDGQAGFSQATSSADCADFHNRATTGDNKFLTFYTESTATNRGSITYNRAGGLVAYNTTSDYRAKDIIGPVQNPGAMIDAFKVYEGQMKGATQSRPMLIAHEAQQYAPYAVTGEKDAVNEDGTPKYQQIDVSSLVPLLLAELQSLRARVAQLESKA